MTPVVLASASQARRSMLERAGVPFTCDPADVDEDAVRQRAETERQPAAAIALSLAEAKARVVADRHPEAAVIGADQILQCEGRLFSKPHDLRSAAATLRALRGKTHRLSSAVAAIRLGNPIWSYAEAARLTMRPFSDAFLDQYLAVEGDAAMGSVGVYRVEGPGIQLFSRIDGDHSVILGLPLLPVLSYLRNVGLIPQ